MTAAKKPTDGQAFVLALAAKEPEGRSIPLTSGGMSRAAKNCDDAGWGDRYRAGSQWRFKINSEGRAVIGKGGS